LLELDAFDEAVKLEPQVRPVPHRHEEAARRRPAPAALLRHLVVGRARVVAAIEIVDRRDAGLRRRFAERLQQRPAHALPLDAAFAAGAMRSALAKAMILVLLEERQHVLPAPAGESELAPMVVVAGLAAHVEHGIDRRRSADHLAARIRQAAAVEPLLRQRAVHPVGARIADGEKIADRDVVPDPVVAAARLEQEHSLVGIGGEPVGQQAAGRTGADDDVVVLAVDHLRHALLMRLPSRTDRVSRADPGPKPAPAKGGCPGMRAHAPQGDLDPGSRALRRSAGMTIVSHAPLNSY
jgi:hypothetical protein